MSWLFAAIATGITSFIATNIDDIIILMLFFSQVNDKFRPRHIIIGQYLGFTVLIAASLPGIIGGLILSKEWLGLLGLMPIFIGIKQLLDQEDDSADIQAVSSPSSQTSQDKPILYFLTKVLSFQVYNVAAVTVANGGDNIGIYFPLFASINPASLAIILVIFYLLIALWCLIAYLLTRHPIITKTLTHYGHIITPFVLIGLGMFILVESKAYKLLPFFQ